MDEDKISLRDKIALSVLESLLSKRVVYNAYINNDPPDPAIIATYNEVEDRRIAKLAEISYRVSDIMRKARLKTFE